MFNDISKAKSLLVQFSGSTQVNRILELFNKPMSEELVGLLDKEAALARDDWYDVSQAEVIDEVCMYLIGVLRGHENPLFIRNLYEEHIG